MELSQQNINGLKSHLVKEAFLEELRQDPGALSSVRVKTHLKSQKLLDLLTKVTLDCFNIREKLKLIESGMKREIGDMAMENGILLLKLDQKLEDGLDCVDLMKEKLIKDLDAQRKGDDWTKFVENMEETLGTLRILDINENQISTVGESTTSHEALKDGRGDNSSGPVKVGPSQGVKAGDQVKEMKTLENGEEGEETIAGDDSEEEEEEVTAGEEYFQKMADNICRKEIQPADSPFPLQSIIEEDEYEYGSDDAEKEEVSKKSCFETSGISKLQLGCLSSSSSYSDEEQEAPRTHRQATVSQDGIIDPASDTDTEEEEEELTDLETEGESEEGSVPEDPQGNLLFREFLAGEELRCKIVSVVSPVEFWVREEGREEDYYQLYNNLQTIYCVHDRDHESLTDWKPGHCCAVKTRDKGWVRAKVLAVDGENVTLRLGDIGRDMKEVMGSLQRLEEEFTRDQFYCHRVKVCGLVPAGSTTTVTAAWSKQAMQLIEERSGLPLIVQITSPDTEEFSWLVNASLELKDVSPLGPTVTRLQCIQKLLRAEGLARGSDLEEQVVEERVMVKWLPAEFPSSSRFEGLVHHVDWEGRLWVTTVPDGARESSRIDLKLKTLHADSLAVEREEWREGEACVAMYPLDRSWYRATVLTTSALPPSVHIRFVDYGTEVILRPDQLRRTSTFLDIPALAFPVRLNVKPKTGKWKANELNYIHETAVDKKASFEVVSPDSEGWVVDMEIPDLGEDFGQFLSQKGLCHED